MRSIVFLLIIALPGGAAPVPAQAASDAEILNQILNAWRERQERMRTVRLFLVHVAPDANSAMQASSGARGTRSTGDGYHLGNDTLLQESEATFDGAKFRLRTVRDNPHVEHPGQKSILLEVSNGVECWTYRESPDHGASGVVKSKAATVLPHSVSLSPVVSFFRMFDSSLSTVQTERLRIKSHADLDGRSCIILEEAPVEGAERSVEYWVDPDHGHNIVRIDEYLHISAYDAAAHRMSRVDAEYESDPKIGWTLIGWTLIRNGIASERVRVVSREINESIRPDEFEMEFPVGTFITDERKPRETNLYLAREDGWRPITAAERLNRATREQLMTTEPGQSLEKSGKPWTQWLSRSLFGAMMLLGFAALARTRRSRHG